MLDVKKVSFIFMVSLIINIKQLLVRSHNKHINHNISCVFYKMVYGSQTKPSIYCLLPKSMESMINKVTVKYNGQFINIYINDNVLEKGQHDRTNSKSV